MGYRVVYGEDRIISNSARIRLGRTAAATVILGILFLSVAYHIWPEGRAVMDHLAGYDGFRETHSALELLILDIQSGVDLRNAVTVFCREILNLGLNYAA